jgi:benzoylformate decarboxylase
VFDALAQRMPPDAIVVEETPSSQPELYQRLPITAPAGYYAAANGGLGFGLAGTIGLRMGAPTRPVICLVGDGSSMYAIQSLWSAVQYHVGALLIVMSNGRYAIMDRLAREAGGQGAWPAFGGVDITGIADRLGCPARRIAGHDELIAAFDEVLPGLARRTEPLLLEVEVGE